MSTELSAQEPLVSVVMAVHNGASTLASSLSSILNEQEGVPLELLVLNDGSIDGTELLLDQFAAADSRLRVWHRPQRGLTASLIELCEQARAPFIARQDAGDRSLPGRLQRQLSHLQRHSAASLCSCHARFVLSAAESDGAGLVLHQATPSAEQLRDGLTGPAHHGAVMMRTAAYRQVGGYRSMFRFAQDIDLWSRLVETGSHDVIPEILYEAEVNAGSISGVQGPEQRRFHHVIRCAARARRAGRSEQPWLQRAERLSQRCRRRPAGLRRRARGTYFIACCLLPHHPDLARTHLQSALALDPTHLRARVRLALLESH
ncbi:MAG: glycosyltransferase family 2 protein [Synechococcaceae cyanobacterium ELA182]